MPKIKVTKTIPIAEDGIHIRRYAAGFIGDVSNKAAEILISIGAAVLVRERMAPSIAPEIAPSEKAVIEKAPEIKMVEVTELASSPSIRVWQLADELGTSSKKIISVAKELKIFVSVPASGMTPEEAEKIRIKLKK